MELIISFLAKHIFETIFTIAAGVVGWFVKRYIKLEKKNSKIEQDEFRESILKEVHQGDKQLSDRMGNLETQLNNFRVALLSLQGNLFREFCEELLEPGRIIAIDEFEQLEEDHTAYNLLGGNHRGDALYDAVVKKFNNQIQQGK